MYAINDIRRIQITAARVARGSYQRSILAGEARVSGSDLKGAAREWSIHYHNSRAAVISRFARAIDWEFDGRYRVDIYIYTAAGVVMNW